MIEWAITSSVLIAVVLILRRLLMGKISLRLQYGLWALVLVRLLVPVSFGATAVSVLNAVERTPVQLPNPVVGYVGSNAPQLSAEAPDPPLPPAQGQYGEQQAEWETDAGQTKQGTPISLGTVALGVWAAGAAGLGLWLLWVNLRFARKLRRDRRPLAPEGCPLAVYVTGAAQTPCLFGLFRPCIYVTEEAAANETVLRHSLAHELTHYRHKDPIWAALRGLCLTLHWYNPLVWVAVSVSRRDGELCCDEATVKRLGENERAAYGRTLLAITCPGRDNPLLTATSMTGSGIQERIRLLVRRPRTALYTLMAVVLVAAVAAGCTFTGSQPQQGTPSVALAEGIDVPQAVFDYARDYVDEQMAVYTEEKGYEITAAEIVGLTLIPTGTAALLSGVNLYRLEYRLHAAYPDQVVLADGMTMEEGAITEWSSAGQPCLLLSWEDSGEETIWTPVCVMDTLTIEAEYGTPEMLAEYENAYTAAAMEVYFQHQDNSAMDEHFYQLVRGWYDARYPGERWYFQTDQPDQPQEGDICIGPIRYQDGGVYLNETIGEVYVAEVSCYENGQFRPLPDPHTLVLLRSGQSGAFQQVLGALERDTGHMSTEDMVLNVALGLADADVSLRRDGYPLPVGPGGWTELFRAIYDGEPEVQVQEGYEPIYYDGDYWDRWSVNGFSALRYYSAPEDRWSALTIDVTRDDCFTPRGIRVGDSRAQVLETYPEALTGDYWGQYPEEPDLLAYIAWNPHGPGEISDLSQLDFYEGLGPAILFFFEGDTLRQITLTNMVN